MIRSAIGMPAPGRLFSGETDGYFRPVTLIGSYGDSAVFPSVDPGLIGIWVSGKKGEVIRNQLSYRFGVGAVIDPIKFQRRQEDCQSPLRAAPQIRIHKIIIPGDRLAEKRVSPQHCLEIFQIPFQVVIFGRTAGGDGALSATKSPARPQTPAAEIERRSILGEALIDKKSHFTLSRRLSCFRGGERAGGKSLDLEFRGVDDVALDRA